MRCLNKIKSIAIGSFDGLHMAHKVLINQVEALIIIERNGGYLTPGYTRTFYTSKYCCFYHFDKIKTSTKEEFVATLKEDFPQLEKIVVGYDFAFGREKSGNANTLKALFDGEVVIVDEVMYQNISVHSRTIKSFLIEGNILMANALLGRQYALSGSVIRGQGLGEKSLVPTINLNVKPLSF